MTRAENTVQEAALRCNLGMSVPVISLLGAIRAIAEFVAWGSSVRGEPDRLRSQATPVRKIS
jgi:hypothetical protein